MRVRESAEAFVRTLKPAHVNIGVLLAGSSPEPIYPSIDWWRLAFSALQDELPDAHFFITGKSNADDRSSTIAFSGRLSPVSQALQSVSSIATISASGINWHCSSGAIC